jgi:hypothetical protein
MGAQFRFFILIATLMFMQMSAAPVCFSEEVGRRPSMPLRDVTSFQTCTIQETIKILNFSFERSAFLTIYCDGKLVSHAQDHIGFWLFYPESLKALQTNWANHLERNGFKIQDDCSSRYWQSNSSTSKIFPYCKMFQK